MTKEDEVMFLMRLAVETHNANIIRRASNSRGPSIAISPMSEIETLYKNYEEFLRENSSPGKVFSITEKTNEYILGWV